MKDNTTKQLAIRFAAYLLPALFLAIVLLLIFVFWKEHDPSPMAAETERSKQTELFTETEPQTGAGESEKNAESEFIAQADRKMDSMSLEEKIAQLFIITPEALTGVGNVTASGEATKAAYDTYPVGGIIYFDDNIYTEVQLKEMLQKMKEISQSRSGMPAFLSVDEEGGTVARLGNSMALEVPDVPSMLDIGNTGDVQKAYEAGAVIGGYLTEYGFDLNFAPDADVLDSLGNAVIGSRSFGTDPQSVADMTVELVKGLQGKGISAALKHFPGHGATAEDTHTGAAYNNKTLEELESSDFLPFRAGIEAGADFVMVGHLVAPNADESGVPSIFSKTLVTEILRDKMGFEGIIITDGMNMDAIAANYPPDEAAVKALQAGVDMLLMPSDFQAAYQGLVDAAADGVLTEERIDASVRRVLALKFAKQQMEK